jgi:hypothetical protein
VPRWNDLTADTTPTDTDAIAIDNATDGTRYVTWGTLMGMVMRVVTHGSTAATARPTSAGAVYWIGSVEPDNAVNGDQWYDTTGD